MRWRKAAAAGGAAIGAAALYNAAAARDVSPVANRIGGEPDELLWRGHRVAFTRHGSGSPVLLVHGLYVGASSFEWRHTVDSLAERYSVFALDLLGFGRSARPALHYSPALYHALLADVITRLGRGPCAVVASSLSAAHLVALAARDPRHVAALGLVAPTGVVQLRERSSRLQWVTHLLLDAPVVGTTLYNGLSSPASVRQFLESTYVNPRLVTDGLVDAYVQSARQPGAKHAVRAFVGGRFNIDVRNAFRRVRQPTLVLWGEGARHNPVEHAHAFRVLKPELEWALIPNAGDLPHDEQPERTNAALHRFLERVRTGGTGGTGASRPSRATA